MKDNTVTIDVSIIADVIISNIKEMLHSENCNEVDNLYTVIQRNLDTLVKELRNDIIVVPLRICRNHFGGFYGICPSCYDLNSGLKSQITTCSCGQKMKWEV